MSRPPTRASQLLFKAGDEMQKTISCTLKIFTKLYNFSKYSKSKFTVMSAPC